VIRVVRKDDNSWDVTQLPEVEGAWWRSIRATAPSRPGGRLRLRQEQVQPRHAGLAPAGSSFKPFIYSAALEKGFSPTTMVNDAPLFFDASVTGGQPWEPKNYDGGFEGPMTLARPGALANMISIRVLQAITPRYAQDWITRFGFDPDKHPPYLTMALGAGSVTPMQMATGFAVFANGGWRVNPYLITASPTTRQGAGRKPPRRPRRTTAPSTRATPSS
jgi:penicillin-binding protein 1A